MPDLPDIHNRRAMSRRELGDDAGARASLFRALGINPNDVEAYVNLGLYHQKAGNPADAVQRWKRAQQLNPTHTLARIYLTLAAASGTTVE